MCLLVAEATARLATFGVLAAEFFVHFHWKTFCLVVAKRTFGQEVKACSCDVLLLLHMLQSLERLTAKYLLQLRARKGTFALRACETFRSAFRSTHLSLDVLLGTVHAEEMHVLSIAADHPIEWIISEAALTFSHQIRRLRLLEVGFFCSLLLFHLPSFDWASQLVERHSCKQVDMS